MLRNSQAGARCFAHNVGTVDVQEAYADGDFDNDGKPDRVWQLPDCLVVMVQGAEHWEFPGIISRPVPRGMDSVSLRAVERNGALVVEVRDSRDEPRTREVHRYRWNGHDLTEVP